MGTVSVLVLAALVGTIALFLRTGDGLRAAGPRLSPDLPGALLVRAGFPVTDHNVEAVRERLATVFCTEADAVSAELGTRAAAVVGPDRAQGVLDAVAETDPAVAVRLAARVPEELLATAGTGRGFFGGSVFERLPLDAAPAVMVPAVVVPAVLPEPRTPASMLDGLPVLPGVLRSPAV